MHRFARPQCHHFYLSFSQIGQLADGDGAEESNSLASAKAVAVSSAGFIFVADPESNVVKVRVCFVSVLRLPKATVTVLCDAWVQVFNHDNEFLYYLDTYSETPEEALENPYALALASDDDVLIVDDKGMVRGTILVCLRSSVFLYAEC